ncbi:MAG TPA: D-alanine--D-alanine ligase, partial [Bacteroidota bacterium]|nr:D-alanine--D-alanine ligase [Bacteroidota bacterium]
GIFNSSFVRTKSELEREVMRVIEEYREPALIEEFLTGREFTVAMLGNGASARALPIVEINFDSLPEGVNHIYSYEAKWVWDQPGQPLDIFQCPARIPNELTSQIESICTEAYRILRCRDWCRIDVRLDAKNNPHIIELNPLPGILPKPEDNSCFPKAARAAGIGYNKLMQSVLGFAARRYGLDKSQQVFSSQYSGVAQ